MYILVTINQYFSCKICQKKTVRTNQIPTRTKWLKNYCLIYIYIYIYIYIHIYIYISQLNGQLKKNHLANKQTNKQRCNNVQWITLFGDNTDLITNLFAVCSSWGRLDGWCGWVFNVSRVRGVGYFTRGGPVAGTERQVHGKAGFIYDLSAKSYKIVIRYPSIYFGFDTK